MLEAREAVFIVLVNVFIAFLSFQKDVFYFFFLSVSKKRDKSIVLCYNAVRNIDLQI